MPTASDKIRFTLTGPAKLIGVGNGDPSCHEPDKASDRSLFNGLAQVLVQVTHDAGDITLTAGSDGLKPSTVTLKSE